jgi:fructoselysine/glucoselysine PTS system EIIA component
MRKFLIAAHGTFSSGIKSSLDIIIGKMDNVFIIDAYVDGNQSIDNELCAMLHNIQPDDELVVFTDLMGGSITNQILRNAFQENVHIVSGMNLPLLIEIMMADSETPVKKVIDHAISLAREQVIYVNTLMNKEKDHD